MSEHEQTINDDAHKEQIKEWLVKADWRVQERNDPKAIWLLTALSPNSMSLVVARPKVVPERIDIQTAVKLHEDTRRYYEDMDGQERQRLLWDIRIGLIQMDLEFVGLTEPLTHDIIILERIFNDGLTRDRFLRRVAHARNGMGYVLYMLRRHFNLPAESDSGGYLN